ncbi:MAG: AGE family epimerase/isomerase [Bacteroidales bacterium]|nr:AGE family epimerase/isomerase [Bacteroidales bacterium]
MNKNQNSQPSLIPTFSQGSTLQATCYRSELLTRVIPFWEKNSPDQLYGGYFTCLDRQGRVYDTDKFVWLQARQAWMFAKLFNLIEARQEWLDLSRLGLDFLKNHARDEEGNWFFSLTREGKPLVQPYNIFSDCFAAMAFGEWHKATGDAESAEMAVRTFRNILRRSDNPKGKYSKAYPGTRPLKSFALPMILCNLALELEPLLEKTLVEETIDQCIHEVMEVFFDPESGLIREQVHPDGSFSDSFEGRLLNPGHAIEAMWFIMDLAGRNNNTPLINRAVDIALRTVEFGWDHEYGGIYYFLDSKGYPPQQLEWDQKLWWVHMETLISLIKGFRLTADPRLPGWIDRVQQYVWSHFPDPEYDEWFGYLNRQGEVLLPLKGGKWKGCYHIPRGLMICALEWEAIEQPQF